MRLVTTPEFQLFLSKNGSYYPFKELVLTRTSIYCKWLLLKSEWEGTRGVLEIEVNYFPVLTSSLPSKTVQELIMNNKALPVPKSMDEIIDSMFVWGQQKNYLWYCDVVDKIAYYLEEGINNSRKDLVKDFIGLYVQEEVYRHVQGIIKQDMVWHLWATYFFNNYSGAPFKDLAAGSIEYTNWLIAQVNYRSPSSES